MALSPTLQNAAALALAGALYRGPLLQESLNAAAHADNPASAVGSLLSALGDLNILTQRVEAAVEECRRNLRYDENAVRNDLAFAGLADTIQKIGKPHLTVVR